MSRPKSTLKNINLTIAKSAHNCKHNSSHRILKGDKRLTIKEDRSNKNYCLTCALASLKRDMEKIQDLVDEIESL